MKGNVHYGKQQYKLALKEYLRAYQASPKDLCVHGNLVATYIKLEKYTQAVNLSPPPPLPSLEWHIRRCDIAGVFVAMPVGGASLFLPHQLQAV